MKFSDLDKVTDEVRAKAMAVLDEVGSEPKKIFNGYDYYLQQMTRVISDGIDSLDKTQDFDVKKINELLAISKEIEPKVMAILVTYRLYSQKNVNMHEKGYISCEKMNRELFFSLEMMKSYQLAANKMLEIN